MRVSSRRTPSRTAGMRLLVTACAATRTTELAARRLGVRPFLPTLFVQRYANMGGLDPAVFADELGRCRSFTDSGWTDYWDALAVAHLRVAADRLTELDGPPFAELMASCDGQGAAVGARLQRALRDAAPVLIEHGPQPSTQDVTSRTGDANPAAVAGAIAIDELVKAITYFQVSAFPGTGPLRMRAYHRSRRLFDLLAEALSGSVDSVIEELTVDVPGDSVRGYLVLPAARGPVPTVVVTNGLEGTVQELLLPLLRYRDTGLGLAVMEMPGSYAYRGPMTPDSEQIYDAVIDHVARHPGVDADRLGFVGVSFGGYWAARMAAHNPRLRCAVACGAPTHHSFGFSLGLPQIILEALDAVTGASHPVDLLRRLRALSLREEYGAISIPLLVINGDHDTLLSTQDSIDLAEGAPGGELLLYPDDDHCAMGHYRQWLDHSQRWLAEKLTSTAPPSAPSVS